jgi:hypothetical protein
MVDPERLKRAEEYTFENGCDIFDALDDIRQEEPRHRYGRRQPKRPHAAAEAARRGEKHPPIRPSAEPFAERNRRWLPAPYPLGSKITGSRRTSSVDHEAKTSA